MAISSIKQFPREIAASKKKFRPPVIKVTRYEIVWAFLVALVLGLIAAVVWLSIIYNSVKVSPKGDAIPVELLELPGGYEDGVPDETLQFDSPEEITYDPSTAEVEQDESEITEIDETIQELSDNASIQAEQQYEFDAENAGKPGSASGTGRRALGSGDGKSGMPREQRWFIRFADRGTLDEYAKQLNYFGIELGALLPGKLVYLSRLTNNPPSTRIVSSGKKEKRLYMTWQGGGRKKADIDLFKRAKVDVTQGTMFQFYPPRTELMLARLEKSYRNKSIPTIKRTYFVVRPEGNGYKFVVTRQIYIQK